MQIDYFPGIHGPTAPKVLKGQKAGEMSKTKEGSLRFCERHAILVALFNFSCTLLANLAVFLKAKLEDRKVMKIAMRVLIFMTVLAAAVPLPTPDPNPPVQSQIL
jgi:hypothetical protein